MPQLAAQPLGSWCSCIDVSGMEKPRKDRQGGPPPSILGDVQRFESVEISRKRLLRAFSTGSVLSCQALRRDGWRRGELDRDGHGRLKRRRLPVVATMGSVHRGRRRGSRRVRARSVLAAAVAVALAVPFSRWFESGHLRGLVTAAVRVAVVALAVVRCRSLHRRVGRVRRDPTCRLRGGRRGLHRRRPCTCWRPGRSR